MKKITACVLGVALSLVIGSTAYAGGLFVPNAYGLSARGLGMGNALTGIDGDYSVTFFNPAALGHLKSSQVDLGYMYAQPNFSGGPKGGKMTKFDTANKSAEIGFTMNLASMFASNHGLGLGFDIAMDDNGQAFLEFNDIRAAKGQWGRYGLSSVTMVAGLGVEILPILHIGGGTFISVKGETTMKARTDLAGHTSDEEIVMQAKPVIAPMGSIFLPFERFSVGAAYRGKSVGSFGPIAANTEATVSDSTLSVLNLKMNFKDLMVPQQVAVGFGVYPVKSLLIAVDCTWMNWKDFENEIKHGDSARAGEIFKTKDVFVPRLGLEWQTFDHFFLRLGYYFEDTPFTTPGDSTNSILDNAKHAGTLGVGYDITQAKGLKYPLSVNAAYIHQYLVPRTIKTADGVEMKSDGNLDGGGITLSFRF